MFASDFVPSDTSIDVDDDPWSTINALISLHAPVRSSLMTNQSVSDVQGTFFEVPVRCKGQTSIFFRKVESKPRFMKTQTTIHEDSKSETELSQFSHYEPNVLRWKILSMTYQVVLV